MGDKNKVALVSEFLRTKKMNVSFLQETHSDYSLENVVERALLYESWYKKQCWGSYSIL